MALKFFWRCEGTTLDGTHDYSAGDTTATATGGVSLSATAAKVGSNGVINTDGIDYYTFDSASIVNSTAGSVGFWIQWPTDLTTAGSTAGFMLEEPPFGTTDNWIRFELRGDKAALAVRKSGQAVLNFTCTTTDLVVGNWYFVTMSWDFPNDKRRVRAYNASGTLVDSLEDTSTDLSLYDSPTITQIDFGQRASATTALYVDNLFIGDAYDDADTFYTKRNITSFTEYADGHPAMSRSRGIPGMNHIGSRFGRGW